MTLLSISHCALNINRHNLSPFLHLNWHYTGLPRSGKKFWKMKNVPGQGKVREFHFQSGKFRKNEKSHGKVREFQKFKKKLLVNWILVFHQLQAILEKEFMFRNIPFLIFMVWDFSLKIKSERINICTKFSNCRWMKMAKIDLPKRSGKRSKVREKSVKSQGILKTILSGNPVISNKK